MHLCHVIESAATGSGSVMLTLAEGAVRAGHEVTVVYSPTRASGQFLQRIAAIEGVRFVPLAMRRAPGPHDVLAVARLRALLRRHRFDVVHSHSSKAGALARLAGIGAGAAQIYSPHGFVTMGADPRWVFRVAERVLAPLGDAIVAVSRQEKAHGLSLGIADARITVIPNGVDERLIAPAPPRRAPGQPFTIGFVGRLSDQKQPLLALDAFRRFADTHPNGRLVMIGGGELHEAVAARIAALGLGGQVELAGERAALDLYPSFDVLLCSSRFEGMPLTFLEALAHGVPIVSTDVGGVDELIDDGENGYVCAATPESLSAGLAKIADASDAARATLGERALAKARRYTTRTMIERTLALYARCRVPG